jgi:hypothetical protein
MKKCSCGSSVANNAMVCPTCGHRFTRTSVKLLAWFLGIPFVISLIFAINSSPDATSRVTDSKGRPVSPGVTNDAELLLARCGRPSKDDSTDHDKPRPPIPSRIVEYKKQRLRFLFVPGGQTPIGEPPYQWKFVGITDMTATNPAKARVVDPSEAVKRMPCWSGN